MSTKNIGNLDRFIRFLIGSAMIIWGISNASYVWVIVGVLLLVTVYTARCLLYSMADMTTVPVLANRKHKDVRYRPGGK